MSKDEKIPDVVAMCDGCKRGYVWVNPKYSRPTCIACGGLISPIIPIPNIYGAFIPISAMRQDDVYDH